MKQTSASFGALKDTVYTFSAKQMIAENRDEASVLNKFLKMIQENSALKVQYLVYKNLENGHCLKERLAERFINQSLRLVENFSWRDITTANKEAKLKLFGDYNAETSSDKEELYESIHTLIKSVTKSDFSEIDKAQNAFDYLMEHLMRDKSSDNAIKSEQEESEYPKLLSWQFITKHAVNKFNERYSHLNESEKELVKMLLSSDENKRNYLSELKEQNLLSIDCILSEDIDETTKAAVNKFKTKIDSLNESKTPNQDIDEAIINLVELKENLLSIKQNN